MVWSPFIDDTSPVADTPSSDDDGHHTDSEDTLLNIHTFYDAYSDDLWFLYDTLKQLIHDAFREHEFHDLEFHDWLEFCFHDSERLKHTTIDMSYMWSVLTKHDQSGILEAKTLGDFEEFLLTYSIP